MTDTFTIAEHHFENAGIEPDKKDDEVIEGQAKEIKDETNLESGTENPVKELQEKKDDKKPDAAKPDSDGSGTDDGKKEEPKKEEPKPHRTEAELDEEGLAAVREGKPTRPEIAQRWRYQRDTARQERDASKNVISRLETETAQLKTQVETFKTATAAMGEVAPAELPNAVRLYSALVKNPVATLKQLLVEAKANGHTIDGIGEGIDTAAITALIDRKLGASEKNNQPTTERTATVPTVDNDDDLFLQAYPDANPHIDIMVQMLNKNVEDVKAGRAAKLMGNTELYFTLKNAAEAQGYDWSKPLQPQIDAKNAGTVKDTPKTEEAPRLNGRGEAHTEPLIATGGVEESFGDIVKRALAASKTQN